jgi:hypothetical protein
MEKKQIHLPNFLIVGAAKCGTTSLYYYLKQHPEVFMSAIKEPHFITTRFLPPAKNGLGDYKMKYITNLDDYCKLFEESNGKKAIGEASAENLYFYPYAITYIKQFLGSPKIIIILRNPVERAFSAYTFLVRENKEYVSFEEALAQEDLRKKDGWEFTWFYKDLGFYYAQVKAYLENFSAVKVYLFDDLKKDSVSLVQDMYKFLGVNADFVPDTRLKYNISGIPRSKLLNSMFIKRSSKVQNAIRRVGTFILKEEGWDKLRESLRAKLLLKTRMNPETKQYLQHIYRKDIVKLQTIIDRDLSHWLNDSD